MFLRGCLRGQLLVLALSWLLGVKSEEGTEPQMVVSGRKAEGWSFLFSLLKSLCFALVSSRHFQLNRSSA